MGVAGNLDNHIKTAGSPIDREKFKRRPGMIKKILFTFFAFALSLLTFAQDSTAVNDARSATGLRAEGKIYVVLLVAVTILVGLFIYLIRLDRKVSSLEKKNIQ